MQALDSSSDFHRYAFLEAHDAMLVFRPDDETVLEANSSACELYGLTRNQLIGLDLGAVSADPAAGRSAVAETLSAGSYRFETVHRKSDGTPLTLQVRTRTVDYNGARCILAVQHDVSAQRAAERARFRSERQYRDMFNHSPQPMWIESIATGKILAANHAATRLYGFSPAEFAGRTRADIMCAPDGAGGELHSTAEGEILEVRLKMRTLRFDNQDCRLVLVRDETEQNRVRRELIQREAYYRALLENSLDVITLLDENGIVRYASPSTLKVTGRTPEETLGITGFQYVHPEDLPAVRQAFQNCIANPGVTEHCEFRLSHKNGEWRYLDAIGHNLLYDSAVQGIVVHSRDATERRQTEEALRKSEERLRIAQRAGGISTWSYDPVSHTTYGSSGPNWFENKFDADRPICFDEFLELVHPEDASRIEAKFRLCVQTGEPFADEFRLATPDRQLRWLATRAESSGVAPGYGHHFLGVNFDITERKQEERELAKARDEALAASRLKSQFLATVSHEIRTPMNGIIGMSGLLVESELTPQQRSDAETIRTSALYLLDLINDLLDLSRMEAGRMVLDKAPFDLRECVGGAVELLNAQAAEKGLSLTLDYPADVPGRYIGNAGRIRQIVLNFAGNAVKFTNEGSVTIAVRRTGEELCLSVRDTGPGITLDQQGKLFQKFMQLDASHTRKHGGTGLGLAITKSLAEAMGGSVGLRSRPGSGSEFWVKLPLQQAPDAESSSLSVAAPILPAPRNLEAVRILAAEDNLVNQKLLLRLLDKLGLRGNIANNGAEAVEMFRNGTYDIVLMDCQMPELDGYDAARQIRLMTNCVQVPIVAVTAHAHQEEHLRCLEAGMDDILVKPFHAHQLHAMLQKWLVPSAPESREGTTEAAGVVLVEAAAAG